MMDNQIINLNNRSKKLDSLQSLRCIAFLMIFLGHTRILNHAGWGVSIFFILSGFLMIYNYIDRDLSFKIKDAINFSIKKIKRLYPLHILMIFAAIVLAAVSYFRGLSEDTVLTLATKIISNVTLIQAWIPLQEYYFSLNGVAWYLSVCVILYFAFPYILKSIQNYKKNYQAYICCICVLLFQGIIALLFSRISILNQYYEWSTYTFPIYRLGDFIVGCNVGFLYLNRKKEWGILYSSILEMLTIVLIPVTWYFMKGIPKSLANIPTAVLLVVLFANKNGIITKALTIKPLIFIGNISAYTFLFHQIVIRYVEIIQSVFEKLFHVDSISLYALAVIEFAITIIVTILYQRIEGKIKNR